MACSGPTSRRQALVTGALAAGVWLAALLWRLRSLDQVSLGSDSLGPFLAAWAAAPGRPLPLPPNPEGGLALWVWSWPLLPLAHDLTSLFALRFAQGALAAPLTFLAAWRLTRSRPAALAAGLLIAADSGLVDTLVSAFRGYGAPEWIALATLGAVEALGGQPWGLPLAALGLVTAAGQHPFAAGAALGALAVAVLPEVRGQRRALLAAICLGGLLCLPRLWWIARLAECGEGGGGGGWGLGCIQQVALGSAEPDLSRGALLLRAALDRTREGLGASLPLAVGVAVAGWRGRRERAVRGSVAWALGGLAGVVLLALVVHSLRPYHLRIVAAPLAVAAAAGWQHLGLRRWGGLLAVAAAGLAALHPAPLGSPGALALHDRAGAVLRERAPAWVEAAWDGAGVALDPAGVVLSAALQGAPTAALRPALDRPVLLAISQEGQGKLRLFPNVQAAALWCAAEEGIEGAGVAHDWSAALYPGEGQDAALWLSDAWAQRQRGGGAP